MAYLIFYLVSFAIMGIFIKNAAVVEEEFDYPVVE